MIPVIDLAPYLAGRPRALQATAAELGRALEDVGFFVIVGHGVAQNLIDDTFAQARRFHAQPADAKQIDPRRHQLDRQRQAVKSPAEIGDDWNVGVLELERVQAGHGAFGEQLDRRKRQGLGNGQRG